jgi:conjugal transfer/type IV secretion protein DotA/TraY
MKIFAWLKKGIIFSGLFLTFGLFSTSAFAMDFHSFFTIAKHDMSFGLLQTIFGQVGGLFGKTSPAILNTMFRTLNMAMLVLLVFVVVYVVIISVVNTAHQGEFLGKKLDSMWVPARVIMAIMLVSPLPCGYSVIQVIMMWVVLQGVGAADCLWHSVTKYLSDPGHTLISAVVNKGQFAPKTMSGSKALLMELTCMHRIYKKENHNSLIQDDTLVPTRIQFNDEKRGLMTAYYALVNKGKKRRLCCGYVKWKYSNGCNGNSIRNELEIAATDKSMTNMVMTLNETAKKIVYGKFVQDQNDEVNEPNPLLTTLNYFQQQMFNVEKEVVKKQESDVEQKSKFWDDIADEGWMSAGMYYYDIAKQNNDASSTITNLFNKVYIKISDRNMSYLTGGETTGDLGSINAIYNDAFGVPSVVAGGSLKGGGNDNAKAASAWMGKTLNPILQTIFMENAFSGDPVIFLQTLGNVILTTVSIIWAIFIGVMTALTAALSLASYFFPAISTVFNLVMLAFTPLLMTLAALFSMSLFLSFYIPMIPYIIFTFAAIGWMIAVFETMLAAPMVAIGLADPHAQHEVLGRAEPALQMLANVFLRPSLMIFGLIGGMILAKAAVGLINHTFFYMTFNVLFSRVDDIAAAMGAAMPHGTLACTGSVFYNWMTYGHASWDKIPWGTGGLYGVLSLAIVSAAIPTIVGFAMMLCIYVLIKMSVIKRCFSLIHMFPDRILSWLGWQAQFGQYSQAPEQELKQGFKGSSDAATKFGQSGVDGAKKSQEGMVQYGSSRGRLANDWGHTKSFGHFCGSKSGKDSTETKKIGDRPENP